MKSIIKLLNSIEYFELIMEIMEIFLHFVIFIFYSINSSKF